MALAMGYDSMSYGLSVCYGYYLFYWALAMTVSVCHWDCQ